MLNCLLAVDDLVLVEVDEGPDDLGKIVLHLQLSESLPPFYQFVEGLARTYLQQNIHVLLILEDVLELHYVLVAQRLVNLDFCDELDRKRRTFCLALDLFKLLFAMILAA